jgi:hypothetical protein
MAEETMESAPMPLADVATGEDDLGDVAVTMRQDPAGDDCHEGYVGRAGEDGYELP